MIKHFSAGGILLNSKNQIFLIHKISRNEWSFPKGTIEENEEILEAAIREIGEETGYFRLKVRDSTPFDTIRYTIKNPETSEEIDKTVYFFIFDITSDEKYKTKEMLKEGLEGQWFELKIALEKLTFPDMKNVLSNYINSIK